MKRYGDKIFEIKKKQEKPMDILFLGLVLILLSIIITFFIMGVFSMPSRILDVGRYIVIMFLLFLYLLDLFMWQINGKEVIYINEKVVICKKGKVFKMHRIIEKNDILEITAENDYDTLKFQSDCFFMGGKVKIKTKNGFYRIGQDVTLEESKYIVKEMSDKVRAGNAKI